MIVVVAVEHKRSVKGAELHEDLGRRVVLELAMIALELERGFRRLAVDPDHLVRFDVNVDGVPPAAAAVAEDPFFDRALADLRVAAVGGVELAVDLPGAVGAVEVEVAGDRGFGLGNVGVRTNRAGRQREIRIRLVHRFTDVELDELDRTLRIDAVAFAPARLLHDVLHVDRLPGEFAEIDHDVRPAGRVEVDLRGGDRLRQEPAVVAELLHRLAVAQTDHVVTGGRATE